jgi:threonine dehydrogenase-like Zn-dependent dehydrogenase
METALNLLLGARPLLGEKVVVLGQGVVGLLVSAILACFFFAEVYALDPLSGHRDSARELGVANTVDSNMDEDIQTLKAGLRSTYAKGADLILELTGSPAALNLGLDLCAYSGRIVVGSWYVAANRLPWGLAGAFTANALRLSAARSAP